MEAAAGAHANASTTKSPVAVDAAHGGGEVARLPELGHLKAEYNEVYEPSDDTFLLLDALLRDLAALRALNPAICLEIGYCLRAYGKRRPGSGCVICYLAQLLGPSSSVFLAADLNPKACLATQRTAAANHVNVDIIRADLVSGLGGLRGKVDVLIFNPPYVPSNEDEMNRFDICAAWAGGVRGREVTDRLLPIVHELLSPEGCFYLVVIDENDPEEIKETLARDGFTCKLLAERRALNEHLSILKFNRKPATNADACG